jgi:hypothetical protein
MGQNRWDTQFQDSAASFEVFFGHFQYYNLFKLENQTKNQTSGLKG